MGQADRNNDRGGPSSGGSSRGGSSGSSGSSSGSSGGGSRGGMADKNADRQGRGEHSSSAGEGRGGMAEKNADRQGRGEHVNSDGRDRDGFERSNPEIGRARRQQENAASVAAARDRARKGIGKDYDLASSLAAKATTGSLTPTEFEMQRGLLQGVKQQVATRSITPSVVGALSLAGPVGAITGMAINAAAPAAVAAIGAPSVPAGSYGYAHGAKLATPSVAEQAVGFATGFAGVPGIGKMASIGTTASRLSSAKDLETAVNSRAGLNSSGTAVDTGFNGGSPQSTTTTGAGVSVVDAKTKARTALASAPQVTSTADQPSRQVNQAPDLSGLDVSGGLLSASRALR